MICYIEVLRNDAGKFVYLGCSKVLSEGMVYDWATDGLPPQVKKRALKFLDGMFEHFKKTQG